MKPTLLVLGLLFCAAVASAAQTIPASTAYAADPQHLWNQLNSALFAPDGDWITARSDDSAFGPLASLHTEAFNGHSVFLVMVRLPQGRQKTVDYLDSLRDFEGPRSRCSNSIWTNCTTVR